MCSISKLFIANYFSVELSMPNLGKIDSQIGSSRLNLSLLLTAKAKKVGSWPLILK